MGDGGPRRDTGMGTIRVGTDLVSVDDVARSIADFGQRYLDRVYTASELAECTGPRGPSAERLAARFAAKESAVKVLRPPGAVHFHDVEVLLDDDGRPRVALHGNLAGHARHIGLVDASLSLSHDGGLATAVLVAVLSAPESIAPAA